MPLLLLAAPLAQASVMSSLTQNTVENANDELALLGGGCFWCLEAVFNRLKGVSTVVSGYAGGTTDSPSYQQVCTGMTGHAEVVQVRFQPALITYRDILEVFFSAHDPISLNRQGNDIGTQYRSVIFYHSPAQQAVAEELITALNTARKFSGPIVTELAPAPQFFPAEAYHQQYYDNNQANPYCHIVIDPKLRKLQRDFADKL
jgi:peptide-methionine (S)-S-oxide reductase